MSRRGADYGSKGRDSGGFLFTYSSKPLSSDLTASTYASNMSTSHKPRGSEHWNGGHSSSTASGGRGYSYLSENWMDTVKRPTNDAYDSAPPRSYGSRSGGYSSRVHSSAQIRTSPPRFGRAPRGGGRPGQREQRPRHGHGGHGTWMAERSVREMAAPRGGGQRRDSRVDTAHTPRDSNAHAPAPHHSSTHAILSSAPLSRASLEIERKMAQLQREIEVLDRKKALVDRRERGSATTTRHSRALDAREPRGVERGRPKTPPRPLFPSRREPVARRGVVKRKREDRPPPAKRSRPVERSGKRRKKSGEEEEILEEVSDHEEEIMEQLLAAADKQWNTDKKSGASAGERAVCAASRRLLAAAALVGDEEMAAEIAKTAAAMVEQEEEEEKREGEEEQEQLDFGDVEFCEDIVAEVTDMLAHLTRKRDEEMVTPVPSSLLTPK